MRLLWKSLRLTTVEGKEHLERAILEKDRIIPCCWHQRLFGCVTYLAAIPAMRLGLLISPSRDGELIAQIARPLNTKIIRGSANRTGAQSMRELHVQMTKHGISPIIHPDGPTGPAGHFKEGVVLLAQWTGGRFLPMSYAVDRYWQLKSWDRLIIPKPFARLAIAFGPLQTVDRRLKGEALDETRKQIGRILDELDEQAQSAFS